MMDSENTETCTEKELVMDNFHSDDNSNALEDDSRLRRKLLDDFVNIADDKMKVYLRIRPLATSSGANNSNQNCLYIQDDNTVVMRVPKDSVVFRSCSHDASKLQQKFMFNKVCGPEIGQSEFFNLTMSTTMKEFIEGQNWLIFAYGITNSGKTYTIKGTKSQPGIIPRAINVLFSSLGDKVLQTPLYKPHSFSDVIFLTEREQLQEIAVKESLIGHQENKEDTDDSSLNSTAKHSSSHSSIFTDDTFSSTYFKDLEESSMQFKAQTGSANESKVVSYQIWISFLEVYNEHIFDLLVPFATQKRSKLHLAQDKNGNTHVKGLCEVFASSAEEAYQLLRLGQKNLRIASTKLNHQSSRSHSVFNIKIVRVFSTTAARINSLSFCDLAGSERCTKTKNSGERLKEAGNINTSLMVLGRCIDALRHNQNNKHRVVPFRDSKLTRIFQSYFTGRGQAAMIVNVNMCVSTFDETMNVMKFSAIANQVITVDHETSVSLSSKIVARLTELWARSSRNWSSIGKGREQKDSILTIDESDVIQEETEEKSEQDKEIYEELVNLVKYLEKELIDAKQQIATMETEIRAEVCQEYSELMDEMEQVYKENARKAEENAEEYMENRIKLLQKAMEKSHTDSQLHSSESESEESSSGEEEHENPNSTVCENEAMKKNIEPQSPMVKLRELQELQEKLKKAEEEVKKQETEFIKAGEIFTEKESEIDNLKDIVAKHSEKISFQEKEILNLQQQLKESHSVCQTKQDEVSRLKNKLKIVEGCEKASVSKNDSLKQSSMELQAKVKELEKQKNEIQTEYNNLKQEFETSRLVNMNQVAQIRLESSQSERDCIGLRQKLSESSAEIETIKQRCREYENIIEENAKEISDLKTILATYTSQPSVEEMQREIEALKEKNNTLNSELMVKNNKILALNSKLTIIDSEYKQEQARKELEQLVAGKSKINQEDISCYQDEDSTFHGDNIPKEANFSNHNSTEKQSLVQVDGNLLESCCPEKSAKQLPSDSLCEVTNYDAEEQINSYSHSYSDEEAMNDECVVSKRRPNLAQELEDTITELNASNERNMLLKNEIEGLKKEKETFSLLLSKAEEHLKLMLYSDEKDVMSLVQEMCLKWKAINDLTITLEKQLLYVTDELKSLTEKHTKEIKNFSTELERKSNEIDTLKMTVDEEVKYSNKEMASESEQKIKELKDTLNKSEEYANMLKTENSKVLHELENNLKEKEGLLNSLKVTVQEKSSEIEGLIKEKDASMKESLSAKQALDELTDEYEKLKNNMVNLSDNHNAEVTKLKGEKDNLLAKEKISSGELETYRNKILELDDMYLNSVKEIKSKNEELDFYKNEIGKAGEERTCLQEKISFLTIELDSCKKKITALEDEIGKKCEEGKRLCEELENSRQQIIVLEDEKASLNTTLAAMNKNLEDRSKETQCLEEQYHSYAEKITKERTCLEEQISFLTIELDSCKKKITALEDEIGKKCEEGKRLCEELENSRQQIIVLEDEKASLNTTLAAMNKNLEDRSKETQCLEEQYHSYAEKIAALNKELDIVKDSFIKSENERVIAENLCKELSVANRKLDEMNELKMQKDELKEECSRYSKELEEIRSELESIRSELVLANEKRQSTENELLVSVNEKKELEDRLKTSNKDAKALGEKLTARLKEVGEEVETWKDECNRLLLTVEEKENANSKLKRDLETCESKLQQLEETLAEKDYVESLCQQIEKKDAKLALCTCNNENDEKTIEEDKKSLAKDLSDTTVKEEKTEKERPQRSRQTRGRGRKRISAESADNEDADVENTASDVITNKCRKTRGSKSQKQASLSADDEDFRVSAKRQANQRQTRREKKQQELKEEEKMSPLRRVGDYLREKSPILGAMTQLILNTVSGNPEANDKTSELPAKPHERRKRRPLFSTDNMEAELFTPCSPQEEKNPHTIVTRQLRSRQRRK